MVFRRPGDWRVFWPPGGTPGATAGGTPAATDSAVIGVRRRLKRNSDWKQPVGGSSLTHSGDCYLVLRANRLLKRACFEKLTLKIIGVFAYFFIEKVVFQQPANPENRNSNGPSAAIAWADARRRRISQWARGFPRGRGKQRPERVRSPWEADQTKRRERGPFAPGIEF